jgi:hypothetical protein
MTIRFTVSSKDGQFMIRAHWNWTIRTENVQSRSRNFGPNFPGAIWTTR